MMKFFKAIFFILLLFSIVIFAFYKIPENKLQKTETGTNILFSGPAEEEINSLTLEQKIGQLFIIGFEGKHLTLETENLIKELHPGGILLLKKNIESEEQLKELVDSLQKIALEDTGLPLFIAIDQEGGRISRLEWFDEVFQSELESKSEAYSVGLNRGRKLKELGVNLNLAPVLDESLPGDFIFERSFQKSPEEAGGLAEALVRGQKQAGIFSAIKHFPGYGGISFNPEEKLATLEKVPEISQFQKAIESLPEMVMVSNVVYDELDEEFPFSFSEKGIGFLKNRMPENVLIVSDDLSQNSLLNEFSLEEIVVSPVKAGVDILIFSGWRMPASEGILAFQSAAGKGEISEQRIDQSVLKIIELKQKLLEQ